MSMEPNPHDDDDDAQFRSRFGYFDPGRMEDRFNEADGPFGWRIKEDQFDKDLFYEWLKQAPASWLVNRRDIQRVKNTNKGEVVCWRKHVGPWLLDHTFPGEHAEDRAEAHVKGPGAIYRTKYGSDTITIRESFLYLLQHVLLPAPPRDYERALGYLP